MYVPLGNWKFKKNMGELVLLFALTERFVNFLEFLVTIFSACWMETSCLRQYEWNNSSDCHNTPKFTKCKTILLPDISLNLCDSICAHKFNSNKCWLFNSSTTNLQSVWIDIYLFIFPQNLDSKIHHNNLLNNILAKVWSFQHHDLFVQFSSKNGM